MNDKELLDLYSDYLISAFGQTTGAGFSALLGGAISHDRIQRLLSKEKMSSADLWQLVKPHVRARQQAEGVLILDDSIAEKPYTDENDIICWHYDHSQDRMVKGINFMSALYYAGEMALPVGFELIAKTEYYVDKKDGKAKRCSAVSKNEHYQALIRQALKNDIPIQYILNDVWFASADNMKFVKKETKKEFVMPIKANRKVALSGEDQQQRRYQRVDTLNLEADTVTTIYLEKLDFPVALVKQVFVNGDGSIGIQYLVSSDTTLTATQMMDRRTLS